MNNLNIMDLESIWEFKYFWNVSETNPNIFWHAKIVFEYKSKYLKSIGIMLLSWWKYWMTNNKLQHSSVLWEKYIFGKHLSLKASIYPRYTWVYKHKRNWIKVHLRAVTWNGTGNCCVEDMLKILQDAFGYFKRNTRHWSSVRQTTGANWQVLW